MKELLNTLKEMKTKKRKQTILFPSKDDKIYQSNQRMKQVIQKLS